MPLTSLQTLAIIAAGVGAGTVNTIIGSGSLITFPTLLAVGYPPVQANVSNNVGLVPGGLTGAIGYRRELEGQSRRVRTLAVASGTGALTGAVLLLALPTKVFDLIVPILVLSATGLMAAQPRLSRWAATRKEERSREIGWEPLLITFLTGVYGGYFGAAQGIILFSMLAVFVEDHLQRLNALKNVLATLVNCVAALVFVFFAPVAWEAAALVAIGSIFGGVLGANLGRRIPPRVLRYAVMTLGFAVGLQLLVSAFTG